MKYSKITDNPNLIRDTSNKAILTINKEEIQNYRKLKEKKQSQNNEINNLKRRIEHLEKIVNVLLEEKNA